MTIKIEGFVEKLEVGAYSGGARLTIRVESSRSKDFFVIETLEGEADAYRPGTGVDIMITPFPTPLPGAPR